MKRSLQSFVFLIIFFSITNSTVAQKISASDQSAKMGKGVNIIGYDQELWKDYTKGRFKEKYFRMIKLGGFSNIRVNLHPFRHMDSNYLIAPKWFETLDWAVEKGADAGLMVILDLHEFNAMADDPVAKKNMFMAAWEQISVRYRDQPGSLVFELLNEPNQKLNVELWNQYLAEAVKLIRTTNPDRTLIIGPGNWNGIESLSTLVLPKDDRNIIVTVHFYHPMAFTHQGAPWSKNSKDLKGITWKGTEEEKELVETKLKAAYDWSKVNDRPIFLGEFGSYDKGDMESRARYTAFVARMAEKFGFSWAYWQFDSDFIVYSIDKDEWVIPIKNALIPTN